MVTPDRDPKELLERLATLESQVQQLRQQLLLAQKLSTVGALAASVTHEFNNILTTVINYAKMGSRHKDGPTRDKAFDKILAASQRAAKITTGMLAQARHQSDRREPTDLVVLVDEILVLCEKDLQHHRVRLETRLTPQTCSVVNASQVQQVLLNLVVNARQAMPNGGTLIISVGPGSDREFNEISVRDTGTGIPAEKLRRIFEPFFTTKTADAQGQGGTGLGLSLAKDVIESHGGRLRVESTVGSGTTFTLKFPTATPLRAVPAMQKVG